ncbi:hypothetical protein, conserved [Trypanosoma brucei gambiense DAL972]|uniref:Uncharacterized protein n=1 Tax=Trypanosoma brucei gambiense (strain MHOM/CI/86/DAL972) TaxID=679716 RepID=D0A9P1_TRYB9|nr:hypothetical protein, conserved [Trypanosoma brucei gambiense DAL972]CBH18392.1 hypothetical protein, conserved [Trypanosoma brucei gambiense DAL972]|eukprot:XP_011780656.1 hypothetical protein, conserved [Trypanosoma brucei gambiense DAL972]
MSEEDGEGLEGEASVQKSTGFSLSTLKDPFVHELIAENEAMLAEITFLREKRHGAEHLQKQCVQAAEEAVRQQLVAEEANERERRQGNFFKVALRGLHDDVAALREENTALQNIMLTVQAELGASEETRISTVLLSPRMTATGKEVTSMRSSVVPDVESKLLARYSTFLGNRSSGERPTSPTRTANPQGRKRPRPSGGDWMFTPLDGSGADRGQNGEAHST